MASGATVPTVRDTVDIRRKQGERVCTRSDRLRRSQLVSFEGPLRSGGQVWGEL